MSNQGVISLQWDEKNQNSYKSITMSFNSRRIKAFKSGDPVIDWLNCIIYMSELYEIQSTTSNQINFKTDFEFDSFFNVKDPNWTCEYIKDLQFDSPSSDFDYRVIVNDKIKTFKDLTDYYTDKTRSKKIQEIFDI